MTEDDLVEVTISIFAVTRRNTGLSEFDENQLIRRGLRLYFVESARAQVVANYSADDQTSAWGPFEDIEEIRGRQLYSSYEWEISDEEYFDRFGNRDDYLDWAFSVQVDAKVQHPAIQGKVRQDLFSAKKVHDLIVKDLRLEIEGKSLIYYHLSISEDVPEL